MIRKDSSASKRRGEYSIENRGKYVVNKTSMITHPLAVSHEGEGYFHLGIGTIGANSNKENCMMVDKRKYELE